ncbi:3-carboxy-cis,cis-muconate cycloisomerase [Burkholderia pseudomallei MSHR7498]|uniref:3-carboxy-cis,cis-muconate cycloisomerase n=1 Tax=Burkholderia pseudomallei TaxID=28450 RepID=UPI000530CF74|nr:3-carboxy-cis,cis-muconate cycloisomerase [Burkholderia pseudomallei]KGS61710.1 3-carboxy-cis,cis-muconate cycloisomerase [Burkholderia pseudomallei MSHR4868]KGS93250.1 3-carboxy-cis,cis-muconate cycloisomerase [Burkholderia pseudomallei MSHR7498]CAJ5092294.1 3-carboxy-cis,cis-muconate cycloisomerase [Burkholderia pseudomallei]CAJ5164809.1 3-carboxy-cis,cis-muconate cycloisomerase [Burkholderia pseudomallei]CAJ5805782.1 3-carboxy-cis,cis-muconate cycloisomerase [Burkholderia pseudomallei]
MLEDSARLTALVCGSEPLNRIWSPHATLQRMLDVEAALARALAANGVIPANAVRPIEAACAASELDAQALMRDAALGGNLAIPLVRQLTARVKVRDAEAAKYVHWGATSQDIIDTAAVLQLRDTLDWLDPLLRDTCTTLATLAAAHRTTPMIGRTWLQQALPITLGLKFAQWLDALLRHRERIVALRERALALQFGGAAGTLASLRDAAPAVARSLADDLRLALPAVPWHTQRDRIAETAACFGMLIGTLGKIARDISLSMQTEIGELAEPAAAGKGGSSTMPHKRNPVGCAAVLTAAVRAPGLVSTVLAGMVQEHERALGGWQAEWDALPELARLAGGALAQVAQIVEGLNVDVARLADNLDATRGLVLGEAVMLALGDRIGRLDAHHLVERASKQAVRSGRPLYDVLAADPDVAAHLTPQALRQLLDPAHYVGEAHAYVDAVLALHASRH